MERRQGEEVGRRIQVVAYRWEWKELWCGNNIVGRDQKAGGHIGKMRGMQSYVMGGDTEANDVLCWYVGHKWEGLKQRIRN